MATTDTYLNDSIKNVSDVKFRSGYGLQARELNALQSTLNSQINAIGDHLFKDGSSVIGGSIKYQDAKSLLIESTYLGSEISLDNFVGKEIIELDAGNNPTGAKAKVIAVSIEEGTDSAAIHYVDEVYNIKIGSGSTVRTTSGSAFAQIKVSEIPVRDCSVARIIEGTYYFNRKFVKIVNQLLVYSKFTKNFNGYVGIEFNENIVSEFDDPSLYDPSRGSENYNAPGAHREIITGTLVSKPYGIELGNNFITLSEIQEGELKTLVDDPQLNILGDILAEQKYDESGDFVKDYFKSDIVDKVEKPVARIEPTNTSVLLAQATTAFPHKYSDGDKITITSGAYQGSYTIDNVVSELVFTFTTPSAITTTATNTSVYRDDYFGVQLSSGKAYVKGYPVELPSSNVVEVRKSVDTEIFENNILATAYNQFLLVDNTSGVFDTINYSTINLKNVGGVDIGSARARSFELDSGNTYRLYLFDIKIDTGFASADVVSLQAVNSISNVNATADVVGSFNLVGVNSRSLAFPVADYVVSSVTPTGNDVLSYISQVVYQQPSAAGAVTFNTSGLRAFFGAYTSELAGTGTLSDNYIFIDSDSGSILTPTTAIIAITGTSIAVNVGVTSNIVMLASTVVKPPIKTKLDTTITEVVAAGIITSATRTYTLSNTDIVSFTVFEGVNDITSKFSFDNGQRDSFYDFGSITLNSGNVVPSGTLNVTYVYSAHTGTGLFAADSYTAVSTIPDYVFETDKSSVNLRNVLDFRPNLTIAGFTDNLIPAPNKSLTFDMSFYLSRRDLIVLSKNGVIKVIEGIPSSNPRYPTPAETDMILYRVDVDQLTNDPANNVSIKLDQNRRYTMKDIGVLDKRIGRLEYETSLSLLESSTKQIDVVDTAGNSRFKTGFLVDNFTGHAFGDTKSAGYRVAVDKGRNELRPMYIDDGIGFEEGSINNLVKVGTERTGYFLTLPYTEELFLRNNIASKGVSVNPYLVTKKIGVMNCSPSSDFWVDKTTAPIRNVNLDTDVESASPELGSSWEEWSTGWVGLNATGDAVSDQTNANLPENTTSIGPFLVDVDISQFIREITIKLFVQGLRPDTDLHVFIDDLSVNSIVVNPTTSPVSEGVARSDSLGDVEFEINIPAGTYRTGERVITVSDEPNNVEENATTDASVIFASQGLLSTSQETVITTRPPVINNTTNITIINNNVLRDPLAQSFWVSKDSYPDGCFLSNLNLFFKRKPSSVEPIIVQIRPMVNGYPHSTRVIPIGEVVVKNADVNIPTLTNNMDSVRSAPTNIKFDAPVYLESNKEYCVVVLSDDAEYELYISEMGENVLGSEINIRKQPILGSSFRSQNSTTWTAFQNEDLMLDIFITKFATDITGSVKFSNITSLIDRKYNIFNYQPQLLEFDSSVIGYNLTTTDSSSLTQATEKLNIKTNTEFITEKIIRANEKDALVDITMATSNSYVAPWFDLDRQFAVIVYNQINYYGLLNTGFFIDSVGTGYSAGTTSISITGGNGNGAAVEAVIGVGGTIDGVKILNSGYGYTTAPTIVVSDTGAGVGSTISYDGFETDGDVGNCLARYLSKPITLQEAFETDQLTIYADLFLPAGTDVETYVRMVADADATPIANRPWILVSSSNKRGSVKNEFIETKFETSLGYTDSNGGIHDKVKAVQVKMVLLSRNSSIVPKVKNFRAITSV